MSFIVLFYLSFLILQRITKFLLINKIYFRNDFYYSISIAGLNGLACLAFPLGS